MNTPKEVQTQIAAPPATSRTPRTDAECFVNEGDFVTGDFARQLETELAAAQAWSEADEPLPEDPQIRAVHPQNKDEATPADWARWHEALRLVGKKRSKYALVDLVNWTLTQRDQLATELRNIASATPKTWGDMSDQFQPWAQSRARHALSQLNQSHA